jgi:hypothetical protein
MFTKDLKSKANPQTWRLTQGFLSRVRKGDRYGRPPNMSDSLWGLVGQYWERNPSTRATAVEIVEHVKASST